MLPKNHLIGCISIKLEKGTIFYTNCPLLYSHIGISYSEYKECKCLYLLVENNNFTLWKIVSNLYALH